MPGSTRLHPALRPLLIALIFTKAPHAHAQEAPANEPPASVRSTDRATAGDLGTVRVIGVYQPPVDPFALDNPVDVTGTRFQRHWREAPSLEEIGMQGGIVHLAINYGLLKAAGQVTKLPGWKHQVQAATARPPPLDEEQAQRAMRIRRQQAP